MSKVTGILRRVVFSHITLGDSLSKEISDILMVGSYSDYIYPVYF